jgi:KDO2-lipid IV(A) lauroyltransferase
MYFFATLFGVVPLGWMRGVGRAALSGLFPFFRRQRLIAEESLALAYGDEKTVAEQGRILRECFVSIVDNGAEVLYYYLYHPEKLSAVMSVSGRERLDAALARGRGVLMVAAHYGNFPLMVMHMALLGYPVSVVVRPLRDARAEGFLYKKGIAGRFETIYSMPRAKCVARVLRALGENRIVFILADQNFGSTGGVYVDFFGRPAATAPGPVIFARRSGAAVLPVFTYRKDRDRHQVDIHAPFILQEKDSEEETLRYNMAGLTRIIEREIRRRPREWAWMHRRWKNRPPGRKTNETENQ